jgi:transposase-like protein
MAAITLKLPEELAERLRNHEDRLPEIIERGLRGIEAEAEGGFPGAAEVMEFLAGLPSPQEILELRPAESLARRVEALLEKNRSVGLNAEEEREWENYEFLEHLVTMAKAKAYLKLGLKPTPDA